MRAAVLLPIALLLIHFSSTAAQLPTEPTGPSSRRTALVFSEVRHRPSGSPQVSNLDFIEIHNTNPFLEDIGGWRIDGDVQFQFPDPFFIGPTGVVVIAAAPADLQPRHGISDVLGPWTGQLSASNPKLRLVKKSGGIVLTLSLNANGSGPGVPSGMDLSWTLTRPSYGEDDPRAWSRSATSGGTPGYLETFPGIPHDSLLLNEALFRPRLGGRRFVELLNVGASTVSLDGCSLRLGSTTGVLHLVTQTLQPGSRLALDVSEAMLPVDIRGDALFLMAPGGTRIVDSFQFSASESGVSIGRSPDGSGEPRALRASSPGTPNGPARVSSVVINEILYNPPRGLSDIEFVELHNWRTSTADLSGWRLGGGIEFIFPANTLIPPRGFLVVAKSPSALSSHHGSFDQGSLLGPYRGNLSGNGERITLEAPITVLREAVTEVAWAVMDEVSYKTGGAWPRWPDGGGSSLERVAPWNDPSLGASWASSDESGKSSWMLVEQEGFLNMAHPSTSTADQLQIMLLGAGEVLVDDVEVLLNGQNRIRNPAFETNAINWGFQGTHRASRWETNAGFSSGRSLRISASDRGDQVANRVRGSLLSSIPLNNFVTLRARVKWLRGNRDFLMRLRSGAHEAAVTLAVPSNLGSPGRVNSQYRTNTPPSISEVQHFPLLPPTNTPVRVTARVTDREGVGQVTLRYRIDPTNTLFSVPMRDDGQEGDLVEGDQLYTGQIPGIRVPRLVAFRIEASDRTDAASTSVFPEEVPRRECLVRIGEPSLKSSFGTYRIWLTTSNHNYWAGREKMSNEEVDATFIYGNHRAVYNVGVRYAGSYYTVPTYDTPTGNPCGYDVTFPKDAGLLGEDHFTLDWPIRDDTNQREQLMFWFCEQLGLPNMYRRYVNVYVNGQRRGTIYDDVQQPDGNTLREFFPEDSEGDLIKTDCWDEFSDSGDPVGGLACVLNTLEQFLDLEGAKKTARYRWNWRPRAVKRSAHDFSALYRLVDAATVPGTNEFVRAISEVADIKHWMTTFMMNDIASYWDGFGNPNSKNTYLYKPQRSGWKLFSWDFDVGLGVFGDPVDYPLFASVGDPAIMRIYSVPSLIRPYYTALDGAMNSFFIATNGSAIDRILRSKYSAFRTNNLTLADPAPIRTWITQRRAFLSNELRRLRVPFAVTTPRSLDLTQSQAGLTLAGIAPPDVESIWINGIPKPVRWTTLTNWSVGLLLEPGETLFALQARGLEERVLPGLSQIVKVNYQAAPVDPVGRVVINEIQFHPPNSGAEFVEVLNVSADASFDLSGWRISGLDFVFPQGSILGPRGYLVVAADATAFGETYGWSIPLAGVFNGTLDPQGEWLRLMRPLPGGAFATVDEVRFSSDAVWAANLSNPGMSLELRDPTQDRRRSANWGAVSGALSTESQPIVAMTQPWRFLDTGEDLGVAWRELNFNDSEWPSGVAPFFNTADTLIIPKTTPVQMTNSLGGRILTHYFRTEFRHEQPPLPSLLRVGLTVDDGAVVYLNGRELLRRRMPNGLIHYRTLASSQIVRAAPEPSVWMNAAALLQGRNVLAVEVHQGTTNQNDLVFTLDADLKTTPSAGATPGAPNRVAGAVPAFPSLWISEIQPRNLSGIRDSAGERDPWLELINGGTSTVSLEGFQLSTNPSDLRGWSFPPGWQLTPGGRLIIWLDGQPGQTTATELHSSLRAEDASGVIILSQPAGETLRAIDHLNWTDVASDESFGRIPDSSFEPGRRFHFPTPGVANDGAAKPVNVWINEWMASNVRAIADPADGDFEDCFELFNGSDTAADLSGYTLTDDLLRPQKYVIPPGVQIPPGGFLRVWADEETGQNRAGGDVHAAFRLSGSGEALGLFAPNGVRVDTVVFGRQTDDVSEGRFGDGAAAPFLRFSTPTPGFPNQRDPLTPGIRILEAIPSEDGSLTLRWTTQPAWRYQVTYKNELSEAVWRPLGGVVQSMGPVAEARDAEALSGDRKFYRIEQIQSAGAP